MWARIWPGARHWVKRGESGKKRCRLRFLDWDNLGGLPVDAGENRGYRSGPFRLALLVR